MSSAKGKVHLAIDRPRTAETVAALGRFGSAHPCARVSRRAARHQIGSVACACGRFWTAVVRIGPRRINPRAGHDGREAWPGIAERIRGTVMSHRDWSAADAARTRLRQQWRALFREWDVVVCPVAPTPAFPHDHSSPLDRGASTATAGDTLIATPISHGQTPLTVPDVPPPQYRLIVPKPVCRLGCRSSDLTLRIGQPLQYFGRAAHVIGPASWND
jgi:hypothetical protein